jgi:hypothetical protein
MSGLEFLPKAKVARTDVPVIMNPYGDADTKRKALATRRSAERARAGRRRTRVAAHAASTSMWRACPVLLLGDPSMVSRSWPRLPDARIEAEIADNFCGLSKRSAVPIAPTIASATMQHEGFEMDRALRLARPQ